MMCAGRGDFKVISVFLNGTVCSFFARTDLFSDWRRGFLRLGVCSCASRISRVSSILYSFYIYILLYIFFLYFIEYSYGSDRVLCNSSVRENRNVNEWWTRGF